MKTIKYVIAVVIIVAAAECATPEAGVKQVEMDLGMKGNIER